MVGSLFVKNISSLLINSAEWIFDALVVMQNEESISLEDSNHVNWKKELIFQENILNQIFINLSFACFQ